MDAEKPSPEEIETVAGTEDEDGVLQPSVDEILDPDPEDASDEDIEEMDADEAEQ